MIVQKNNICCDRTLNSAKNRECKFMRKIITSVFIILLTLTIRSQSIDVEIERFPDTKKLEVKSFNGCCAKKGYRAVYLFDNKGQAIELSNYFKRKLLAKYKFTYNEKGLLTEKVQLFDINNKNKVDTTKYIYEFDEQERLVSKSEYFGQWELLEKFQNFNNKGFPTTTIRTFDNKTTTYKIEYDSIGHEIKTRKAANDSVIILEEKRYNAQGDISYSIIPDIVGKDKKGLAIFVGGNRYSAIEEYEYIYDNLKRWIEKYVVFENKKILIEKRKYK